MNIDQQLDLDFFLQALDKSPNPVFVKDRNFVILYANQAFRDMYPPNERDSLIGRTTAENFPASEQAVFFAEDERAFQTGYTELIEELTDYQGAKLIYFTRKWRMTTQAGAPCMLGICTNMTEIAVRERALVQRCQRLENYAGLAAHDLRTPLATYAGLLEVIRMDPANQLSEESRLFIQKIIDSAAQLRENISRLLATMKETQGSNTATDRDELLNVIQAVRFNLEDSILKNRAHVVTMPLPPVKVEAGVFRSLFQNLVENAIRYRSAKDPVVVIRYQDLGNEHLISVEDNGIGIAPERHEEVFDLYSRVSDRPGGTGIGLSLCRQIVEARQGRIWIDPAYAHGCRINLQFPKAALSSA